MCVATGVPFHCGWAVFAFTPACNGSLPVVGRVWCACGVSGLVQDGLGLELSQRRYLPEMKKCQTAGTFPLLSPEKLLFVGRACSQTSCLPSAHCWGHSQTGVQLSSPLPGAGLTLL